jgi:hypothetical protein
MFWVLMQSSTFTLAAGIEVTPDQTVPGRFVISGAVLDPSGASIPGATVQLRKTGNSPEQSIVTNDTGSFRFTPVAPGRYEVDARRESFKSGTLRVVVRDRDLALLRIVLPIAELREVVFASGQTEQVNTNPGENLDVVSLDRKALRDLPALDQDVIGAVSAFLDASALGSGGAALVVNGMETSEKGVSASAIKEVKINQNPYSAEFSRPGRGRIEIVTKAEADAYHGTFNFLFRDYHLDARNAFAQQRPPEQRRIFEGDFTGPLGSSGKSSFLITANHEEQDLQAVVYASTPAGLFRANVTTPERQTEFSVGLNHELSKKNTISIRYEFGRDSKGNSGVGEFNLPEVGYDESGQEHHLYYNHRTVFTTKLVNDFSLRAGSHDNRSQSQHPGLRKIIVQDAYTGGGAQADTHLTENHVQISEALSWLHGRHSIKAGINIPDISRRGSSDRSNFDGTYTFSTLQDYFSGMPFLFQSNIGNPHLAFWQMEFGGFVQDDFRLRPNLSLGLGLRYDLQNHISDHNNLAPRLSFAFAPDKKRKFVFRGGAGFFYDRTGAGAIGDVLRFDGINLRQILITRPTYPDPWSSTANLQLIPPSVVRFAGNLRSPYSLQYGVGVERQLHKSTTLAANYIESRGVGLFRSRDINSPLSPYYLERPDQSLGRVRQIESSASSRSRSLEILLRGNLTRFFNGTIQYTSGRAYNDTSGINSMPANNYGLSGEWSRADFDQRHRFNVLGSFKVGDLFKLGVSSSLLSGRPYSLTLGTDVNNDGNAKDRPAGVGRNSLQGPGSATLDLRWSRELKLTGKKESGPAVTLALNVFNVLNRVNYTGYVGNLSSPFFGLPVSARPARRMQLALKFEF